MIFMHDIVASEMLKFKRQARFLKWRRNDYLNPKYDKENHSAPIAWNDE